MRGKWAEGIQPRNFNWVVAERLAVCERPGGYGASHRRVRRQEEIIWLRRNGFDVVVSLISAPHNLHNYDELDLPYLHRPWPSFDDLGDYLQTVHDDLERLAAERKRGHPAQGAGGRGRLRVRGLVPAAVGQGADRPAGDGYHRADIRPAGRAGRTSCRRCGARHPCRRRDDNLRSAVNTSAGAGTDTRADDAIAASAEPAASPPGDRIELRDLRGGVHHRGDRP